MDGNLTGRKYLTVYGHFYQPYRRDPFTGKMPQEPGARPYHDFNQKIDSECYRPNAEEGNFAHISFDVGPTLAAWLEKCDSETNQRIIAADQEHLRRYGYGSALAQAYNHTILPLGTSRDKRIQIAWGIADFTHRFGHRPEGMWLGETAVDYETLGIMADMGITFTVLAPWQAASTVDVTEPYLVRLSRGKNIIVFFFDDRLSGAVSFDERATSNADAFATQMLPGAVNRAKIPAGEDQLILIATDGEVYGHHKPLRDKFLSYLLDVSAPREGFEVITLSRYLRLHPPVREALIEEDTSWSCHHGVKRWRGQDDCVEGLGTWKWYLRHALNKLAAKVDVVYEGFFKDAWPGAHGDPWAMVQDSIGLKLGEITWRQLLRSYRDGRTDSSDRTILRLIEAQYYRQLMFTSCGFFFEDLDRIEPRNNIAFAARAIDLVERALPTDPLEDEFVSDLAAAKSWKTNTTGADIYNDIRTRRSTSNKGAVPAGAR